MISDEKMVPCFLFLSLSGCNDALAGWHNVMFYAFNDYSGYDSGNMTILTGDNSLFHGKQEQHPQSIAHVRLQNS